MWVKARCLAGRFILMVSLLGSANARGAVFNPDGATHNGATGAWDLPTTGGLGPYDNCLDCHDDKASYLLGGHKNMSRKVDGLKWTMPGVDSTHPFLGDPDEASVGADGSFLDLWIKEDYPRMPVDWLARTIAQGY